MCRSIDKHFASGGPLLSPETAKTMLTTFLDMMAGHSIASHRSDSSFMWTSGIPFFVQRPLPVPRIASPGKTFGASLPPSTTGVPFTRT